MNRRAGDPVVTFCRVSKSWTDTALIENLDLDIRAGTITTLIGPSGSGKTTVLMLLAGWLTPERGTIDWHGEPPRSWSGVALLPQTIGLLPELTLLENVMLPLRLRREPTEQAARRAHATLDTLELSTLAHRLADEVSLGQQQRAALARAAVTEPDLLLADEPTSHQDPTTTRLIIELLHRLGANSTACVIACHDPAVREAGHIVDLGRDV